MTLTESPNYINHIALVIDASGSMHRHAADVVKVADAQIAHLAQRSKELDQETRVTVYVFAASVKCVVYDKDVLRLPSLSRYYQTGGWTALIDAIMQSQEDLAQTAQLYGDHSFLTYIITDGEENYSRKWNSTHLADLLRGQAENWTVAVFVPDAASKAQAIRYGIPTGNVAVWNASSDGGVQEVGEIITRATDSYMMSRSQGVRGSRNIFATDLTTVNKDTIKAAKLKPLVKGKFTTLNVDRPAPIREFVLSHDIPYVIGCAFYQLTKRETIQPQKVIAVRDKKSGKFYAGPDARQLIGLSNVEVRVSPDFNPNYDIFVQSTSVNRKLVPGTTLLVVH